MACYWHRNNSRDANNSRYANSSRQVRQKDSKDNNSNGKGNDNNSKDNNCDSKDDDSNSDVASIKKGRIEKELLKNTTLFVVVELAPLYYDDNVNVRMPGKRLV